MMLNKYTMQLFFIRHGESVANANNLVSPLDTPLSSRGIKQSKVVCGSLINKNISMIICSPILRARQTAEIIADQLNLSRNSIKVINELQERNVGELAGLPRQYKNEFYYNNNAKFGMEPRQALIRRMSNALVKIKTIIQNTKGNVAIIGHCVSGFYLLQIAKGHKKYSDFEPIQHMNNLDFETLNLNDKKH